jgi:hypothetical protein
MRIIGLQAEHLDLPLRKLPENTSVDPADLPLSKTLRNRIATWDAILQSEEADASFVKTGRLIARDMQRELGEGWKVVYNDNKDVSIPIASNERDVYWSATDSED